MIRKRFRQGSGDGSFSQWFNSREEYLMKYDSHRLLMNTLYFVVVLLLAIFVYSIVNILNNVNVLFVGLGSFILLVLVYYSLEFLWLVLRDFRKFYHNMRKGYKVIWVLVLIIVLLLIVFSSAIVVSKVGSFSEVVNLQAFNLFSVSKTIGSEVVDFDSFSSKSDMRSFISFLPLPWAFIIFWAVLIGLLFLITLTLIFYRELPSVIVILLIIFFVFLALQYKIPYDIFPSDGLGACDLKGNLNFGLNEQFVQPCTHFVSSECRPKCVRAEVVCQCEARFYDFVFNRDGRFLLES